MAENKKSFIAYSDWNGMFQALPDEVAGKLIKHIFLYVNDKNPETDDFVINALFEQVKSTLKRDLKKWEGQRIQRSEAGKKSAESRSTKFNDRSTTVNERQRNSTVSVSVSDSVNVNESEIKSIMLSNFSNAEKMKKILSISEELIKLYDPGFEIFWNEYHDITGKDKTDKKPALKKWQKLSIDDQKKAFFNIQKYFDSLNDKKYCKKARTYLEDENFNDEVNSIPIERKKPSLRDLNL